MFAYNPKVNDMSGQIMAQGQIGAAQSNAQMMSQLGSDIGGALASIGGMYAENKGLEAKAKGYDQVGKILGDSMFKNNPAVGAYLNEIRGVKNPMERIAGYEALFGMTGPISNAMNAQGRIGVQQDQQALTAALPDLRNRADAEADVAAGEAPYRPANRPRGVIPGATAATTTMPVISQNPNPFQQARMPFAGMGGNR